jgi:hypothetical protein
MNANEVIASYVTDVAARLPRRQRNDVAFELRALLDEALQAKADDAGRPADATMAIALLREFGRPADVAARYRPTLTIIDPEDGRAFLRATVVGLAIIWCAGLLAVLQQPIGAGWDLLTPLARWWAIVIQSLWWPGVLVVGYGLAAWSRRRFAQASEWTPRAVDGIQGGRASMVMGLLGILLGVYLLVKPHAVLDFFWGGHAAPVAYQALTYTDGFLRYQGPILLGLILLNVPLMIAVIVRGRRSAALQRLELVLGLLTCAAMLWVIVDGPILMSTEGDRMAKGCMALIVAFVLIGMGIKAYRNVRPAPDHPAHVSH